MFNKLINPTLTKKSKIVLKFLILTTNPSSSYLTDLTPTKNSKLTKPNLKFAMLQDIVSNILDEIMVKRYLFGLLFPLVKIFASSSFHICRLNDLEQFWQKQGQRRRWWWWWRTEVWVEFLWASQMLRKPTIGTLGVYWEI